MAKKKTKKKKTSAKPNGRPPKYRESMCGDAVEYMRGGKGITELAALFEVSRETIHEWRDKHPKFSDAIKLGLLLEEKWWCDVGQNNLLTPAGVTLNSSVWIFNMKNRFGWRDKKDITGDVGITEVKRIILETPE